MTEVGCSAANPASGCNIYNINARDERNPAAMAPTTLTLTDLVAPTTGPQLAPLAFTRAGRPIYLACGAEGDDEEDDDAEDDDKSTIKTGAEGGDEDENGDKQEFKAPTEEEWKRTQAALARANNEAKRLRLKSKGATPKDDEDAGKKAEADAERKFKPIAVRSAAKAALLEAGLSDVSDARMKRLLRQIDMDDVDIDEDGDVLGLDGQIDGIKEDFPELFATKTERKRVPKLDASGRSTGGDGAKPKSMGEKIAASVLGGK
jgi:hypothetical protein